MSNTEKWWITHHKTPEGEWLFDTGLSVPGHPAQWTTHGPYKTEHAMRIAMEDWRKLHGHLTG